MKYHEAKKQLQYALRNQKTISISKLSKLLQSMNISVKKDGRDVEVEYLKNEIRKLRRE